MPYLIVKNREKTIFEGDIENISSYNKKGLFDILLDHSNFISIAQEKIILRQKSGKLEEIPLDNALVKVRENKIYIYLGI